MILMIATFQVNKPLPQPKLKVWLAVRLRAINKITYPGHTIDQSSGKMASQSDSPGPFALAIARYWQADR